MTNKMRLLTSLVAISVPFVSVRAQVPTFALVANSGSNTISTYSIDPVAGGLTLLGNTTLPGSRYREPTALVVDGSSTYTFVLHTQSGLFPPPSIISRFRIEADGTLTSLGATDGSNGGVALTAATTAATQFVYLASYDDSGSEAIGVVEGYRIGVDGSLTSVGNPTLVPTPLQPRSLTAAVTPSGNAFLYVGCKGSDQDLLTYQINPNGTLTRIDPASTAGYDPMSIAADVTGSFLYVADRGSDIVPIRPGNLFAYTIDDAQGSLTQIQVIEESNPKPSVVTTHPFGPYAYVAFDSQSGNGTAQAYLIGNDGQLALDGSSVATGQHPASAATEVSGTFLYVTNTGSNNVSQFAIDQTDGSLKANGAVDTGPAPRSVATSSGS